MGKEIGCQEISRCHIRGESEVFIGKDTSEVIHSVAETRVLPDVTKSSKTVHLLSSKIKKMLQLGLTIIFCERKQLLFALGFPLGDKTIHWMITHKQLNQWSTVYIYALFSLQNISWHIAGTRPSQSAKLRNTKYVNHNKKESMTYLFLMHYLRKLNIKYFKSCLFVCILLAFRSVEVHRAR